MTHLYKYLIGCLFKLHFSYTLLLSIALIFITASAGYSQTTYTWTGLGGNTDWGTATNWFPLRAATANSDILRFTATASVTNVPNQTIRRLQIVSPAQVTLQASANRTLTFNTDGNAATAELDIASGATLNLGGTGRLTLDLTAGATGSVGGNINFNSGGGSHGINVNDNNALIFNNGAIVTQNSSGYAFMNTNPGTPKIVFTNGSTFISNLGNNPFGSFENNPMVSFQPTSLYIHKQSTVAMEFSRRTYGNFELDAAGYNQSSTGTLGLTVYNFTVKSATTVNMNLTGDINIKGNVTVTTGNLNFSPTAINTINFNGTGTQTIGGAGNITTNNNTTMVVAATSYILLQKSVTINGPFTVDGTVEFDATAAITGAGSFTLNAGSKLTTASDAGISASGANTGSIQVTGARNFPSGSTIELKGLNTTQVTGSGFPPTVSTLILNNQAAASAVTLSKDLTVVNPLTVNGTLKFGTTAQILTLSGNVSGGTGAATLDMSSGDLTHILNLGGATNTNVTIIQGASCNSSVNYNRAGNQTIFVGNYANLTIAGSGTKILQGDISVCKTLTVAAGASLTLATYEADVSVSTTIGGTLDAGTGAIKGAGSFTLNNTATLVSASPDGISTGTTVGSIQVAGTRSYVTGTLPGAGFIYNGTTNQITGNNLPLNITNFTINTTATLTMSRDLAIAGAATFTAGMLSINGNTLTLNGTTNIAGSGSISGGSTSKMIVAGSSGLATNLPDINNGLFSLYINKTGAGNDIYLRAGETLTIYNAGTLTLQAGVLRNANTLIMGENASALTNIVRYGYNSSLNGTPTFNNKVNLTYMAPGGTGTELPTAANVLNNFTITNGGVLTTLSTNATVNGTLTINTFNNGLFLDGRTLTINGDYVNNSSGTFYGSTTSSIIINGNNQSVSQGLIKFNQTSAATRSLANFTLNRTGTGSAFTISTPVEITNAFITSGILTASGGDILMTNTTVGAGGKLINNSGAFPANLPSSPTTRAFNNTTFATVNKFDILNGSAQTGNSISGNGSDLTFTRNGAGSVYALRSRAMSPVVLPTAVIRFNLGVTSTVANTNAAGTLMIGSNLGDNATLPTAAARLQFNLTTANSKITLTSPDGTPYISADNLDLNQTFTWIINNSGTALDYVAPDGSFQNIGATGRADLWHGTTRLVEDLLIQTAGQAMQQIKFVMDNGTGSIALKNLRINPLATITTTPITCYTAGYTLSVNYIANLAGNATLASASFNDGNEFRVQLSDAGGGFGNPTIIGGNGVKSVSPNGTVTAVIPVYALGGGYRYRVVSTDLSVIGADNGTSMFYVSPGLSQSMLPSGNGTTLTANTPVASSYQWGYRTTSGSGFTAIPGATLQTYTPSASHFASGNPGTYYVICRMNFGGCTNQISNEVIIYINCPAGPTNYVKNGTFDNLLTGNISFRGTSGPAANRNKIVGTGTSFITQLRPGRKLFRASDNALIGTVASIQDNTNLTLAANAAFDDNSGTAKYYTDYDNTPNTGTITTTAGSITVTATGGAQFLTQIQVGDIIVRRNYYSVNESSVIGTVASIAGGGASLTLVANAPSSNTDVAFNAIPASLAGTGMYFNTDYRYINNLTAGNLYDEGNYTVGTNPNFYHGAFCNIPGSTPNSTVVGGSGNNMLIANANATTTKIVWSQTVTGLIPNRNYVLTFNAISLAGPANSLVFGMYINCNRVGEDIISGFTGNCNWARYSIQVNTGSLTTFDLGIANISAAASGNDIAIDDIQFYECSTPPATPFSIVNKFKWRGFNTNWFNSDNWGTCPGILPTCSDDVEIPANMPNYPVINNNGAVAKTVKIDPNAILTINADRNLNVCGDIVNNGTINNLISASNSASVTFISYSTASVAPAPLPTKQSVSGTSPFTRVIINQNPVLAGGVTLASDATINTTLDINASNTLVLSGYGLTLNGNISANTGTITGSNTSDVTINGSGDAGTLRFTTGSRQLAHLTMNRASNGQVTLGTDLTLAGSGNSLTLSNGLINTTTANLLTLEENATVTGGSSSAPFPSGGTNNSLINGPMAKKVNMSTGSFTFPVGKANQLGQIGITPNMMATTNKRTFRAEYFPINAYSISSNIQIPPLDHISKMEYWTLDRTTGTDGVDGGKVRLHWTDYSVASILVPLNSTNMRVVRYDQPTDEWQDKGGVVGGTADYNTGYVTSTYNDMGLIGDITKFSPFTLGSLIAEVPLPVELITLKAEAVKKVIQVSWQTANEHNSAHFIVERSGDGVNFTTLAKIAAAGNSKTVRNYVYTDLNPLSGTNYYRLQQVDRDATVAASKIVWADILEETETGFELYPNPSHGGAFSIQLAYRGEIQVSIYDLAGVNVGSQTVRADGQMARVSPRTNLSPGMYIVRVVTPTHSYQQKLMVK